jgi:trimeric autotransporter adhesin
MIGRCRATRCDLVHVAHAFACTASSMTALCCKSCHGLHPYKFAIPINSFFHLLRAVALVALAAFAALRAAAAAASAARAAAASARRISSASAAAASAAAASAATRASSSRSSSPSSSWRRRSAAARACAAASRLRQHAYILITNPGVNTHAARLPQADFAHSNLVDCSSAAHAADARSAAARSSAHSCSLSPRAAARSVSLRPWLRHSCAGEQRKSFAPRTSAPATSSAVTT